MYLKKVNIKDSSIEGKGYFADEYIPMGTVVYFYSKDDIFYSKDKFESLADEDKEGLIENAVEDEFGNWVLTQTGPYTNHSCDPNIYPLFVQGKYFDIAVKNISKGDEITIDYSMFFSSIKWSMNCGCGSNVCRKKIGFGQSVSHEIEDNRFKLINNAVIKILKVDQPLFKSDDPNAILISKSLREISDIECVQYTKYSIISSR